MIQHRRPGGFNKLARSPLFIFLLLALLLLVFYSAGKAYYRRRSLENDLKSVERRISRLNQNNKDVIRFLNNVSSEAGVEKEAKARFNLKRVDENVVVVLPKEATSSEPSPQDGVSFFIKKILNFFRR